MSDPAFTLPEIETEWKEMRHFVRREFEANRKRGFTEDDAVGHFMLECWKELRSRLRVLEYTRNPDASD